ncbi:MAG: hypothetical protein QM520_01195 [Gammaproteobacteria bacterium]|nr:hypothetical protein [Gammaproteobacteria bacterium]
MNLHEFYQKHYFHEIERHHQIDNSMAIPLGIISVVGGVFVVVAKEIDCPFDGSEWFQLIFLGFTVIASIGAGWFLTRAYWGYKYVYIRVPLVNELKKYCDDLQKYYMDIVGKSEKDARVISEEEMHDYIDSEYAKSAQQC